MSEAPEALDISTEQLDTATVIRIAGEVDLRTSPQLRSAVTERIADKPARVIVELGGVSYMDSSGVGTLVYLKREAERAGCRLVLAGLQPRVRAVFEIAQLDRFFTIAGSVEEAARP